MEALKRSLMLLRPADSRLIVPGRSGGALKLLSRGNEIELTFKADCLRQGDFFLYLFTTGGKELYAGDVTDGTLVASLSGVPIESIAGAAVVARDGSGGHSFCLKSTGPDWPALIERFRLRRAPRESAFPPPRQYGVHDTDGGQAGADAIEDAVPAPPREPSGASYTPDAGETGQQPDTDYQPDIASAFDQNVRNVSSIVFDDAQPQAMEPPGEGVEEESCDACPHAVRENNINPFPSVFPNSEWVKISYPGPTGWWHYISGKIYKGGVLAAKALGVPGEYGMAPPIWLEGFGTYLRCFTGDARGYWLMFQDAETGEVLDMGLSPHGG